MIIRLERADDRAASFEIERVAFERDLEAEIARTVADEEGSFALVAEDGDTIIAHVQMSRGWVGATPVAVLGPIGVLPERRRQGCGGALVRAALEEAARRGERVVMLLGSPAYYPRFGFVPASTFGLKNPYAGVAEEGSRSPRRTSWWRASTRLHWRSRGAFGGIRRSTRPVEGAHRRG